MDIHTTKKLGAGVTGTVYLAKFNNDEVILKMEKYDGDLSTKSPYVRQIIFNKEVAKKYPDNFLTLIFSGIVENCGHKQKIPLNIIDKQLMNIINKNNKFERCSVLCYKPVLKYSLHDVRDKFTSKTFKHALDSLIKTCKIMAKYRYQHRDIHPMNIMCSANMKKWYIIDYSRILHKKFEFVPKNDNDNPPSDILSVISSIVYNKAAAYLIENKMRWPPFKKFISRITKDNRFKSDVLPEINKINTNKKNKHLYNEIVIIATILYRYDLYMDALGLDHKKYPKLMTKQIIPNEYFMKIIGNNVA